MVQKLKRYLYDDTGTNPDNLVKNEIHTLEDKRIRAIAPYYGVFYGDSVTIRDLKDDYILIRDKDYVTADLLTKETLEIGQSLNGVILIINKEISETVSIDYQVLGGDYFRNNLSIENLLKYKEDEEISYQYIDIQKKPKLFKSSFHLHRLDDIYGLEYISFLLEQIRNALLWNHFHLFYELIRRTELELNKILENELINAHNHLMFLLSEFKSLFSKTYFDLDKIKNLTIMKPTDAYLIGYDQNINFKKEAYLTLESLSKFKQAIYEQSILSKDTRIGLEYGSLIQPKKEILAKLKNGSRYFIESYDNIIKKNIEHDITVFPNSTKTKTKFSIWKISNLPNKKGGVFLSSDMVNGDSYIGKLSMLGDNLLMEWRLLKTGEITHNVLSLLINHLTDYHNPHNDTKEHIELELVENLEVANKTEILNRSKNRKYITLDLLDLFMKGYLSTQKEEEVEIEEEPNINVMKRFDVLFTPCGDACDRKNGVLRHCEVEVVKPKFKVFTQRLNYRSEHYITETKNPKLKEFNPVIYEAYTKRLANGLVTQTTLKTGIELVNIPEVLKENQTYNYGTLYQGFRSGIDDYRTTDPYYDTYLVVRDSIMEPRVNGAIHVYFIKSYDDLVKEYGNASLVKQIYEFPMQKGDYLLKLRVFNRPQPNLSEDEILDFERKEQIVKLDIFSAGYTFYLDLRTAIFDSYHFLSLKERFSPKVVPSIHYPGIPEQWFTHKGENDFSSVVVGTVTRQNKKLDIVVDEEVGINTLLENNKTLIKRPAYFHGSLGLSPITLRKDENDVYTYPNDVNLLPRDYFYNGILDKHLNHDRANILFEEQSDLAKSINYNIYTDPFIEHGDIIKPRPYYDYIFKNPYSTGSKSKNTTRYKAFLDYIKIGFYDSNQDDQLTQKLNSNTKYLPLRIRDPITDKEYAVVLESNDIRFNLDTFTSFYKNYIMHPDRVIHPHQPKYSLPYADLIEIPKKIVNQYKRYFDIVDDQLVPIDQPNETSLEIDVVELGRLERQKILIGDELVQYNSLFVNTVIVKYWLFKNINPVFDVDDYRDFRYHIPYPNVNIDKELNDIFTKKVTIYSVIRLTHKTESDYAKPVYGCKAFETNATIDLNNQRVTIQLPEHLYKDIKDEMYALSNEKYHYEIKRDEFSTFDIMFGIYDYSNKVRYEKDTGYVYIDLSHKNIEDQIVFFKHHLKYIQWNFDVEIPPIIQTSVPYPITYEDTMNVGYEFIGATDKNFGHYIYEQDELDVVYDFINASPRKMLHEYKLKPEYINVDYKLIRIDYKKILKEIFDKDHIQAEYEFLDAYFVYVGKYINYKNYQPEFIRTSYEFIDASYRKVRFK